VALKILPEAFARDAERLQRFENEARAVAALNHPNILSIHDVGTQDGMPYLVSELLEGQTLRQELAGGALPLRRAAEYGTQIAEGLAAAHDKGLIHRDLKPENVFVTRDGRIKILDFGLAKLAKQEPEADEGATLDPTGSLKTSPGKVLGTAGYMSPEQVRGEPVDSRSDIFALGAILYEMVSGRRAFHKGTSVETLTAILNEEPADLTVAGSALAPGVERIVRRCLEKNPVHRFQSARDLAFALQSLGGTSSTESLERLKTARAGLPWAAAAVTVVAVLALGAAVWLFEGWRSTTAHPKFTRLTYERGVASNARFARDGQTVVYSAQWNNDPIQLFSVRVEFPQSTKVNLPSAGLLALAASGDMQIAADPVLHPNFLLGTMAQAQMAGGTPRELQRDVIAADYAPDGKTLALVRSAKGKVQLEFPAGKVLYETSGYLDYLRVSPRGDEVAFAEHPVYDDDRGWVSLADSSGKHTRLTKEFSTVQGLAWSVGGDEIWFTGASAATDSQIYGVTPAGKMREIYTAPERLRILDIAADGRVLLSAESFRTEVTGIDPATGKERRGLEWFNGSEPNDILPDGKALLFLEWGGAAGPLYETVYRKLDGSAPVMLGPGALPRFSPDGRTAAALLFTIPPQIALHPIGAGESRQLSLGDLTSANRVDWFPDGKHLLILGAVQGQPRRTYEMDLEGGKPQPLGPPDWRGIAASRDGKRIAGYKESGEAVIFNRETQKLEPIRGVEPQDAPDTFRWTKDGQALMVASQTLGEVRMYRLEVATGKRTLLRAVDLADKAGAGAQLMFLYAEESKTYAFAVPRLLGSLYVVEGLK